MKDCSRTPSLAPESPQKHTKRAEIDLGVLQQNYRAAQAALQAKSPTARIIAVVKADAYGHGCGPCVRGLLEVGCDFFAVSCIEEARSVRRACRSAARDADILILGYTAPHYAKDLQENNLIQTLLSKEYASNLALAAREENLPPLRVHVAVDTGMGRIGYPARTEQERSQSVADILSLQNERSFDVCGMFTHFARADETSAEATEMTERQADRYRTLRRDLENAGFAIPFHHTCNSAAALTHTQHLFDGARLGIALYGALDLAQNTMKMQPVMRLSADIIHTQVVPAGESIGYGSSFTAKQDTLIGVLPIGYADGIPRTLKGASLLLETKNANTYVKIVGNVCMDQCMIDLSGTDATVGDRVTFFGQTPEALCAQATHAGTIPYELLCAISLRVPRIYLPTNKKERSG